MGDLPANVTFDANLDGFRLDQSTDRISSVHAFRDDKGDINIELWGTTTVITPAGNRHEDQQFQQNAIIEFDDHHELT